MIDYVFPFAVVIVILWVAAQASGVFTILLEKLKSFHIKVDFFDKDKSNNQKE